MKPNSTPAPCATYIHMPPRGRFARLLARFTRRTGMANLLRQERRPLVIIACREAGMVCPLSWN